MGIALSNHKHTATKTRARLRRQVRDECVGQLAADHAREVVLPHEPVLGEDHPLSHGHPNVISSRGEISQQRARPPFELCLPLHRGAIDQRLVAPRAILFYLPF